MKILHTSDWHIGSTFYGKKRYQEYTNFFAWLHNFIQENQIDILLVSGDIFDTALPSNTAQEQYYSFLIGLQKTSCKHVIITAGNHDSPSFLTAPKNLLKSLNIHVIGTISQFADKNSSEEIIAIHEKNEEIIILAVPFLRERDLQTISITDDYDTRAEKIVHAIKNYYAKLTQIALEIKSPKGLLFAMGHLYVADSKLEEEGERELYIGSLAQISAAVFPKEIDYVALGHIHSAQKIANSEHIRYCGSPLAMSFSEKSSAKKMILLETGDRLKIKEVHIPEFQKTLKISGDLAAIQKKITELKLLDTSVWLEIEYSGEEEFNLKDILYELVKDSKIEILKFKNQNLLHKYSYQESTLENLENLTPDTIFENILTASPYTENNKQALLACYHEILSQLHEQDSNE